MQNIILQNAPLVANAANVTKQGVIGGGWKISHSNLDASGVDEPFSLSASGEHSSAPTKIELRSSFKWFRVEYDIPKEFLSTGNHVLNFKYKKLSDVQNSASDVKIIEYIKGRGETFLNIARHLSRTNQIREVSRPIEVANPTIPEATYTLCFEFKEPINFWLGEIEFINLTETHSKEKGQANTSYYPPYRIHDFNVSKNLKELNDSMDPMMRKNPLNWAGKMLKVALSLEDYDTGRGLAEYIVSQARQRSESFGEYFSDIVSVFVATGEHERVIELIQDEPAAKKIDSALILARALSPKHDQDKDYRLPSGRPDIFNLSRDLNDTKRIKFETVLLNAPNSAEASLLWANYNLFQSTNSYEANFNSYLRKVKCPYSIELGTYDDNVLKRIKFHESRNMSHLSEGPLVSVIIAAFNAEKTIEYAIDSILRQTYKNIEVLVCDDASTDDTAKILLKYRDDPRIKLFASCENQGPYNVRNSLINESKGELITFHDADDIAFPHRISKQLNLMIEQQARVSLGLWLRLRENGHFVAFRDGTYLRQCLNSIMFFRSVYQEHGPYRSSLTSADSEFYEKLRGALPRGQIAIASEPLVLGLWSSASLTRTAGIEANEVGYRSVARRAYSSKMGRQRILGRELVSDMDIELTLKEAGIYREDKGVIALELKVASE
ncbi:MAG: glycosyltransferase family 2 protein [Alteromonadaceae bacterium]|nr:glycosyltransferase family 2 protein [Alteromonadaceae bacterium]